MEEIPGEKVGAERRPAPCSLLTRRAGCGASIPGDPGDEALQRDGEGRGEHSETFEPGSL